MIIPVWEQLSLSLTFNRGNSAAYEMSVELVSKVSERNEIDKRMAGSPWEDERDLQGRQFTNKMPPLLATQ